jgi:hypothetical protein
MYRQDRVSPALPKMSGGTTGRYWYEVDGRGKVMARVGSNR